MTGTCPIHGGTTVRGSMFACCWTEQFDDGDPTDLPSRQCPDRSEQIQKCREALEGSK